MPSLNEYLTQAHTDNHAWWPVEFNSAAWAEPIRLVSGAAEDQTFTLETGESAVFSASGLGMRLADMTATGNQSITLQLNGVTGDVLAALDLADEAEEPITVTMRSYLKSDHTQPLSEPIVMTLTVSSVGDLFVTSTAGFHDYFNSMAEEYFTEANAPGATYF